MVSSYDTLWHGLVVSTLCPISAVVLHWAWLVHRMVTVCGQENYSIQGIHLSGKPGNVRDFETCQGCC